MRWLPSHIRQKKADVGHPRCAIAEIEGISMQDGQKSAVDDL
jgi:hypothetical protein